MRISHAYPARSAAFVALAGALLALSFFAATQGAADRSLPHGVWKLRHAR
jgi:hypothetical protein